MKKLLYQYRKLILIAILPYLFIVIASIIHINYDITAPGELNLVETVIAIDEPYAQNGSFNTVSVFVNEQTTLLSYLLAKLNPILDTSKTPDFINLTREESKLAGKIQKSVSINNALIASYSASNHLIDYQYVGIIIHTTAVNSASGLEIGDIIINWNGLAIDETVSRLSIEKDKVYQVSLIRDNELIKTTVKPKTDKLGIYYYHYYKINHATPSYQILESKTIGPSGGLMQALAIYNALTEVDITGGLKIAGTGTIEANGQVGPIGGIYQKIFTAHYLKADLFFVPVKRENGQIIDEEGNNYHEALKAYQAIKNPKMLFVPVETLYEAIKYLEDRLN